MLSSHVLILLVEVPVRLHRIENSNSKIRIDSTLLNMSLYCKIRFISALERLILMYCCQFCKVLKKKKKSTVEERLNFPQSWAVAELLKYLHFLLLSVWRLWDRMSGLCQALSPERSTGTLALCAFNQTSLCSAPPISSSALEYSSAKLAEDRTMSELFPWFKW